MRLIYGSIGEDMQEGPSMDNEDPLIERMAGTIKAYHRGNEVLGQGSAQREASARTWGCYCIGFGTAGRAERAEA